MAAPGLLRLSRHPWFLHLRHRRLSLMGSGARLLHPFRVGRPSLLGLRLVLRLRLRSSSGRSAMLVRCRPLDLLLSRAPHPGLFLSPPLAWRG